MGSVRDSSQVEKVVREHVVVPYAMAVEFTVKEYVAGEVECDEAQADQEV